MALTRDFLKELGIEGLSDEHVQKIMDEHGKTINSNKGSWEETKKQLEAKVKELEKRPDVSNKEYEGLKNQVGTLAESLKKFDGVDLEDLNRQLEEAREKSGETEKQYQERIKELEKDAYIRETIAKIDFSSNYAKRGVYDELKKKVQYEPGEKEGEPGKFTGLDEAIEELKQSEPSAFVVKKDDDDKGSEGTKHSSGNKDGEKNREVPLLI